MRHAPNWRFVRTAVALGINLREEGLHGRTSHTFGSNVSSSAGCCSKFVALPSLVVSTQASRSAATAHMEWAEDSDEHAGWKFRFGLIQAAV